MSQFKDDFVWRGRDDTEDGERGRRWHHAVNSIEKHRGLGLVGFACDIGVHNNKGRLGAAKGPDVIRKALANQALHQSLSVEDAGTIVAEGDLQQAQKDYGARIAEQLRRQDMVVGLGGGHEIAWGSYNGLYSVHENANIGIINFDAHFDLRKPAPNTSSGTPFRQIAEQCQIKGKSFNYCCLGIAETANTLALFDYARQSGTRYLLDLECTLENTVALLEDFLKDIEQVYVTICLDALPASVAPGVSAPSPIGISAEFIISVLHWLADNKAAFNYQWQLVDIAEMNPEFDIDNRTAKLAARLIHEIVKKNF